MKHKFKKLKDGAWSKASKPDDKYGFLHKIKCCDCGLVHLVQYELTKAGSLRFRAWRMKK